MNRIAPSDEIALFLRVLDSGSFAATAAQLGMTPSGVSKLVSRLERRLGVRLLHRTTRRLMITPEGETMLARGRGILDAIEAMEAEIASTHGKPKGLVKLNVGTAYGKWCDGFRMAAQHGPHHAHSRAGVRKPPGKEGAGLGALGSAGAMGISLARSVRLGPCEAGSGANF